MPRGSLDNSLVARNRSAWVRLLVSVLLATCFGLPQDSAVWAQSGRESGKSALSRILGRVKLGHSTGEQDRPRASNRYLAMARQLLGESRKLAADGKIDAAIQLAERADTLMRVASKTTPARWPDGQQTPGRFLAELRAFQAEQAPAIPAAPRDPDTRNPPKPFSPLVLDNGASEPSDFGKPEKSIGKRPVTTGQPPARNNQQTSPYQLLPFEVAVPRPHEATDDFRKENQAQRIPSIVESFPTTNDSVLPFVGSSPIAPKTIVTEPPAWRPLDEQPIAETSAPNSTKDESVDIEPVAESEFLALPITQFDSQSRNSANADDSLAAAPSQIGGGTQQASLDKASLWTMALIQTISTFAGLLLGLIVFVGARFFILKRYGEKLGWVLRVEHVNGSNTIPFDAAKSQPQNETEENESHGASFEDAPFPFRVVGATYADEKEAEEQREREREQALLKHVFEQNLELQNQLAGLEESAA